MQTAKYNYQILPARHLFRQNRFDHSDALSRPPIYTMIIIVNLLAISLLFTLRFLDDNRLVSWQWVMSGRQLFILGMILSGLLLICWRAKLHNLQFNPPLGLFLLAVSIGLVMLDQPEVIIDSARYFSQAKYMAQYGLIEFIRQWGSGINSWTDLPLIPAIYGLAFKLFGESRLVIQGINLTLFAGCVVLTYAIGKTLWDETTGVYGGLLLLCMPYLLTQVPLMMVDVPGTFFLTLTVWSCLQVIHQPHLRWILLAAVSLAMAMLCKYSAWMMMSVLPVLLFTCHRVDWRQGVKRLLWVLCGAGLLLLPFFILKFDLILAQLQFLHSYQLPGLRRWQESPISSFFFQIHPFVSLAALASIYFAVQERDRHYLPLVWMWLLILALGINRSRYIILALPMLALMAAYGIRRIHDSEVRHYLLLSIVMTSLVLTMGAYRPFLQNTGAANLQAAGRYLDRLSVDVVEVIVLPQIDSIVNPEVSIPILDLFTRQPLLYYKDENLALPMDRQRLKKSAVRFSWELSLPDSYRARHRASKRAIAVISSQPHQTLPAAYQKRLTDYHITARFTRNDGVFRFRTNVIVYELKPSTSLGISQFSQQG